MKKSKRKVRNPVKTADRSIRRARSPKRIRLPLSETLNEALHRASYPTRYETEPVLIFLDEARALGQLDGGAWFKHLRDCYARTEIAEAEASRAKGELARMVKRLVEILTPEQLDHAKVAGCNPEVYAIELLHLWREKDRDRRTMAESSSDPDLSFPGRIKSFRDLKSGQF